MTVRAKFVLNEKRELTHTTELVFETQYDEDTPEDMRFELATPTGKIQMNCNNPKALEQLRVGKAYYVDFEEVPVA